MKWHLRNAINVIDFVNKTYKYRLKQPAMFCKYHIGILAGEL